MGDGWGLVPAVGVTAVVVALVAALLVHAVRAPGRWLATIGTLLLVLSLAAGAWQPPNLAWDGALNLAGYALVLSAFPDGRVWPRWLWFPVTVYLGMAVFLAFAGSGVVQHPVWQVMQLPVLLFLVVAVHRYRRRLTTEERESMRWALLGAVVTFVGMTSFALGVQLSGHQILDLRVWGSVVAAALVAAFPIGLVVGLVAPRIAPADAALHLTLRLLIPALPLVLVAGAILALAPGAIAGWLAVAATTMLVLPLWKLATRAADVFVYQRRLSPDRAIHLLDERLGAAAAPQEAPRLVANVVEAALAARFVRVSGPQLNTEVIGDSSDAVAVAQPVVYGGMAIATIEAAPRLAETALTRADLALLARLASRAAPALHGASTFTALLDTRADLVLAHAEERKRLRRDLHDDLAPTLVGLRLTASGLARLLREGANPIAREAAECVERDVEAAIAQTRALAYGLRPPVLDDHGLVAAVRDRARSEAALRIDIQAPEEPLGIPAAVEVAALRVVQEAVTNVRRHAHATRCIVHIERTPDALRVDVDDDGRGMSEAAQPGLGLASIRGRVEELGGFLTVRTASLGGVQIAATIPAGTP